MAHMFRKKLPKVKPDELFTKWKVVRGDLVQVMVGKDKGKQGIILKALRPTNSVLVEGCNLVKKHVKGSRDQPGGIATKEAKIHVSNVALVDPSNGKPSKIAIRFLEDGKRVRVAKKTGTVIPRPAVLTAKRRVNVTDTPKDTAPADVLEVTYIPMLEKRLEQLSVQPEQPVSQ